MSDNEEKQAQEPDVIILTGLPKISGGVERFVRPKYDLIESQYERPRTAPDHCELQKFALDLCRRNMSAYYSFKACKLENEDVDECMKATKRRMKNNKLVEASKKVGDKIPELYGNLSQWLY